MTYYLDYETGLLYTTPARSRLVDVLSLKFGDVLPLRLIVLDAMGTSVPLGGADVLRLGARMTGVQALYANGATCIPVISETGVTHVYEMLLSINTTVIKSALAKSAWVHLEAEISRDTYEGRHLSSQTICLHIDKDIIDTNNPPAIVPAVDYATMADLRSAVGGVIAGTLPGWELQVTMLPDTAKPAADAYYDSATGKIRAAFALPVKPGPQGIQGDKGGIYMPALKQVSGVTTLSWTNDAGLANPTAVAWTSLPAGGTTGQVLTRTAAGYGWTTPAGGGGGAWAGGIVSEPSSFLGGVTIGSAARAAWIVMGNTNSGAGWSDIPDGALPCKSQIDARGAALPAGGAAGQYLIKTISGSKWVDGPTGGGGTATPLVTASGGAGDYAAIDLPTGWWEVTLQLSGPMTDDSVDAPNLAGILNSYYAPAATGANMPNLLLVSGRAKTRYKSGATNYMSAIVDIRNSDASSKIWWIDRDGAGYGNTSALNTVHMTLTVLVNIASGYPLYSTINTNNYATWSIVAKKL